MKARKVITSKRGATAVIVAIVLTILVSITALVIDVGYGLVVRNELQNAADACALAGARELGETYGRLPCKCQCGGMKCQCQCQMNYILADKDAVIQAVKDVARQNYADGKPVVINTEDIKIGTWDPATKTLQVTDSQPDAVSVIARRDENSSDGPITTFFARVFGVDTMNISAKATAALTDISKVGRRHTPMCISSRWFDSRSCSHGDMISIQFDSNMHSHDADIQWATFDRSPVTADETELDLITGDKEIANALADFKNLYNANKDPVTNEWEVLVPVLDAASSGLVVGFATVAITGVSERMGRYTVEGDVLWGCFGDGHGCGHKHKYGTKGTIPALVQ
ncbi:MAG: pilus assembly protein TadG-related protein [Thermodesulfobacteriota bacterium]